MAELDNGNRFQFLKDLKTDIPAGVVVFLVALPLCLGIALASGAPLFAGIISGIVGGLIIGFLGSSQVSVSGPAAGLTTIVLASIASLGDFRLFLVAVFIGGLLQVAMAWGGLGTLGNYFPSAVIKGMLAAIGLILLLKQLPHALGYDRDFEGDESFAQVDGENTFSEIINAFLFPQAGAVIICAASLGIMLLWETRWIKKLKVAKMLPGPLVAVISGVVINELFRAMASDFVINKTHLVSLPIATDMSGFAAQFAFPEFSGALMPEVWIVGFKIAIVASLETLLSIEAVDKLDPYKRSTPPNKELRAQGIGNMVSGLIGGLPITAVIVRSSANIAAGGKTKVATITHGSLLLFAVMLMPQLLNTIPLASLAAILLTVGYKLAKPSVFLETYRKGKDQFIPFAVTIAAILVTDLLVGITIGILVGLFFVLKVNYHKALFTVNENGNYLIRLTKDVSFLNKPLLRKTFHQIPDGSLVIIDGSRSAFIDQDILETINDFRASASNRNIDVELRQSVNSSNPIFRR